MRLLRSIYRRYLKLRETMPGLLIPSNLTCYGLKFKAMHPRMNFDIRYALSMGIYEGPEVAMIRKYLKPGDSVVEIGVGIGATSMVIHDIVGSDNFVTFDGDANTLALARENFELNGRRITAENCVLVPQSSGLSSVTFYTHPFVSSSSLAKRGGAIAVEAPAKPIEQVLKDRGATALVMDIEGGEVDLLTQASDLGDLELILMETHVRHVGAGENQRLLDHLEKIGFNCVEKTNGDKFVAYRRG